MHNSNEKMILQSFKQNYDVTFGSWKNQLLRIISTEEKLFWFLS